RSRSRCRSRDRPAAAQAMAGHLDQEGIHAVATHVAGPDEVLAGDIEVALGRLVVAVAAAGSAHVGHGRRHHQQITGAVEAETDDLVGVHAFTAVGATATGVLLIGGPG